MTSPTATARPWGTPVRAPRRDPAKKRGHGPGQRGPGLRDTPAEGGQCITDFRQHPTFRQISASARHRRPVRASDLRPRVSTRQRPVRARGGALSAAAKPAMAGATISRPNRASSRPQADAVRARSRRRCSASSGRGRPAGPSARRRSRGLYSSGSPTRVCNPAVSATAFDRRPGRLAGAQYGKQGCRRPPTGWTRRSARRASGAVCETAHPNSGKGPRPPGPGPGRCPVRWATASDGSRAGRSTELFDAGVVASVPPSVR